MKKILSVILAAVMLFSLVGCVADNGEKKEGDSQRADISNGNGDEVTYTPESDPWQSTAEETTGAPFITDDDYKETVPGDTEKTTEETTYPDGPFETVVTDADGTEWVVGSSNLFGSSGVTTSPETTDSETTAPETETKEPEESREPEESDTPAQPEEPQMYPTVLMYHCVHDEPYTENTALFVRPSELEKQLQLLIELDIDCLFADEFGPVSKNSVILTFDDGYEDNYTYMFPLIKKYNIKVTVFMIAYMIDSPGYLTTEQIKEMSDSGLVQFGSHTLDHPSLVTLSEDAIREQFAGSSWIISQKTGKEVTVLAYPSGDYNDTVMRIAREYYKFAYTTDANAYWGQDDMMLPRYAILRDHSIYGFRTFVE